MMRQQDQWPEAVALLHHGHHTVPSVAVAAGHRKQQVNYTDNDLHEAAAAANDPSAERKFKKLMPPPSTRDRLSSSFSTSGAASPLRVVPVPVANLVQVACCALTKDPMNSHRRSRSGRWTRQIHTRREDRSVAVFRNNAQWNHLHNSVRCCVAEHGTTAYYIR